MCLSPGYSVGIHRKNPEGGGCGNILKISGLGSFSPFRDPVTALLNGWRGMCCATGIFELFCLFLELSRYVIGQRSGGCPLPESVRGWMGL